MKMPTFSIELIKTDVTALAVYDDWLLAGIGSQLHKYQLSTSQLLSKATLFYGLRIHNIEINPSGTHCLFTAENELLLTKINFQATDFIVIEVRIPTNDWILTTKWLQFNNFVTVSMHNHVEFYNNETLMIAQQSCAVKCILYSAHICFDTINYCVVLSGTVFSEILVWRPYFGDCVYHHLKGHEGVIFCIYFQNNYILSSSDDRSITLWEVEGKLEEKQSKISLKHRLHGHTARVFCCQITTNNDFLLSAGEDGKVNVWDFDGNLKKSFNVHHGGCVWSLAYYQKGNKIITGGSDSSIAILPLPNNERKTTDHFNTATSWERTLSCGTETPKKLCLLSNGDVVIITESGLLMHSNQLTGIVSLFAGFPSYCLLEVSPCRRKFAIAGIHGEMKVFSMTSALKHDIVEAFTHCIPGKRRIFAIHWLSCHHLLSCGPDGVLYLWNLFEPSLELTRQSADGKLQNGFLLLGKYILPPSKERWSTTACRIPGHGIAVGDRKGHLHYFQTTSTEPSHTIRKAHSHLGITHLYWDRNRKLLTSLGRNSTMRTYQLSEDDHLIPIATDVLNFSWLATKLRGENTILGFSGDNVVLWDCESRSELFSANCGGGHRSWDATSRLFVYIRDKAISFQSIHRPTVLTSSTHSTELNTVKCLKFSDRILLISGGEDTTLRFSYYFKDRTEACLVNLATIKAHLSSIRCLHLITSKTNNYEMVTAGGRGQLIYWLLALNNKGEVSFCKELHSFYEPQDEEIRVMDLTSCTIDNEKCLFCACSDGTVRIYKVENEKIVFFKTILYKLRCILKLTIIQNTNEKPREIDDNLLITMATDGFLCFWNLETIFNSDESDVLPIFSYKVHASGINAFDFKFLKDLRNTFCFLTGGDDNQISFVVFEYSKGDFKVLYHYKNVESHCAQITGVYLGEKHFFTASLDQKLLAFEYDVCKECNINFKKAHSSTISDIKGINVFEDDSPIDIILYGLGIEMLHFVP